MATNNQLKFTKNKQGKYSLNTWDAVRDCSGLACKLHEKCPYVQSKLKVAAEDKPILLPPPYDSFLDRYGRGFNPSFHEVTEEGVPVIDDDDYLVLRDEVKPSKASLGPCMVERKYILDVTKPFLLLVEKVPDPFVMQWVGTLLIPLYVDLIQFKMKKLTMGELEYEDAKGIKHMHPVFDEMRKTIKEIMNVWKATGLIKIAEQNGFFISKSGDIEASVKGDRDYEQHGNPNWVDELKRAN